MKRIATAIILLVSLASSAAWAGYQEGLLSYDAGEFESALKEFRALAEQGHGGAEFMLGVMYFNGAGVPRDVVIAAVFFHQAAQKGDPGAQLAFGSIFIRGIGVRQDLIQAHYWLSLAARNGTTGLQPEAILALRNATAQLMTEAEIGQAEALAKGWRAARAGLIRGP